MTEGARFVAFSSWQNEYFVVLMGDMITERR